MEKKKECIKIKYFTDKIDKLDYIDGKSDWIDLRASEDVALKQGEFRLIPLGVPWNCQGGMRPMWCPAAAHTRILELSRQITWE